MLRIILGVVVLVATVLAAILILLWIAGINEFSSWMQRGSVIAAIIFLVGSGIALAGFLIESGLRLNKEQQGN